jgi:diguanylate cyclase (GGDEF)-like protein
MRCLIVNENGVVYMDSYMLSSDTFMFSEFETSVDNEFPEGALLNYIKSYLDVESETRSPGNINSVKLPTGPYRYVTIAPIRLTELSAIIVYNSSSLLNLSAFIPLMAILLISLIVFALATNAVGFYLIFSPLDKLGDSLKLLGKDKNEDIYGTERNDELGHLSNTIKDLFTKANHDALTGVYNRHFMESNLQSLIGLISRSNGALSIIMIDVDYFKKYNDTYGHDQGDYCLRQVASAIAGSVCRSSDFTARYGGEEFIAVLPNTDKAGACLVAEKFVENVRKLAIPHASSSVAPIVTISAGVATGMVAYTQRWEEYIKCADKALYMSKQNGRNRFTYLEFPTTIPEQEELSDPAGANKI